MIDYHEYHDRLSYLHSTGLSTTTGIEGSGMVQSKTHVHGDKTLDSVRFGMHVFEILVGNNTFYYFYPFFIR